MILPSENTKTIFKVSFLPDDFALDLFTLQHQQTQDPVLKTVYHWIRHNAKPEYPTPLIHGSPLLHAYYKIFPQLLLTMALISLVYIQKKTNHFLIHN